MEEKCKDNVLAELTVDETVAPPKVVLKRPAKKAKEPEVRSGKIVAYCKERGYMGFECDGHGYQVPITGEHKVGDTVKFTIDNGVIALCG